MADLLTLRKFESLGPFEIKNELISLAKETSRTTQSAFLNAGRGNPNWIATEPRELLLPARPVRDHREPARHGHLAWNWGDAGRRKASLRGSMPGLQSTTTCLAPPCCQRWCNSR